MLSSMRLSYCSYEITLYWHGTYVIVRVTEDLTRVLKRCENVNAFLESLYMMCLIHNDDLPLATCTITKIQGKTFFFLNMVITF